MRTGHMSVRRGKRVLVIMRSGHHVLAKFKATGRHEITFFDHEPIARTAIRTLSIYREPAQ